MNTKELLKILTVEQNVCINNVSKTVLGMARYATVNNPNSEYIKVSFTDNSGMYFPLDEDVFFYFDSKLGSAEAVSDEMIGRDQKMLWNGRDFKITNANDYQYVKELIVGTINEIEGEVKFSDYEDEKGNVLSLGWNMNEGCRDDVYAVPLDESAFS